MKSGSDTNIPPKSTSFSYSSFLSFRRGKSKPPKNVPKAAASAENLSSGGTEPSTFTFLQPGTLEEALQFKVGKLVVQNGDLSFKAQLSSDRLLTAEKRVLEECQKLAQLENSKELLQLALEQSKTRVTELKLILSDYEKSSSLNADEKWGDYLEKIRLLEQTCSDLRKKNERDRVENDDKVRSLHTLVEEKSKENRILLSAEKEAADCKREIQRLKGEQIDLNISLQSLSREFEEAESRLLIAEKQLQDERQAFAEERREILEKSRTEKDLYSTREDAIRTEVIQLEKLLEGEREQTKALLADCTNSTNNHLAAKDKTILELEKKVAGLLTDNEFIRKQNKVVINETLVDVERKLRDSEMQKEKMARVFTERLAQDRHLKEQVQSEYEKRFAELGVQFEADYKRKARLCEEQAEQRVLELQAESEKQREAHQQYREMVDKRLEQHSKSLKDQHKSELLLLQNHLKKLDAAEKDHKSEVAKLEKALAAREAELRTSSTSAAALQKKLTELEQRLTDTVTHCSFVTSELERYRQMKDPALIVQATLANERESMSRNLEIEYSRKIVSAENAVRTSLSTQLDEQRTRSEKDSKQLREEIYELKQQISLQNTDHQKRRAEFADKKSALEDKIAYLNDQVENIKKTTEQKCAGEVKLLKELNEKLQKKLKQEKSDALRAAENGHKIELQTLEDKYKSEKSLLLRQHREEQRDLLANVNASLEKSAGRNLALEIQQLQNQNLQLIEDRQRMCAEIQQSSNRMLEQTKADHKKSLQELSTRNEELTARIRQSETELFTLRNTVSETEVQKQNTKLAFERDLSARLEESNRQSLEAQQAVREEYEKKLQIFQSTSAAQMDQMERQLQLLVKEVRRTSDVEKDLKHRLNVASRRNEELEKSHSLMQRKLNSTAESISNVCAKHTTSKAVRVQQ